MIKFIRNWQKYSEGDIADLNVGLSDMLVNYKKVAVYQIEETFIPDNKTMKKDKVKRKTKLSNWQV